MKLTFEIPEEVLPELAAAMGLHPSDQTKPETFVEVVLRSQMKAVIINYRMRVEEEAARLRIADQIVGI